VPGYKLSEQEHDFGFYEHGRWAWILANVRKLESPIPAVGRLKLWDFETDKSKIYGRGWGALIAVPKKFSEYIKSERKTGKGRRRDRNRKFYLTLCYVRLAVS
jgi:hypothetical protein